MFRGIGKWDGTSLHKTCNKEDTPTNIIGLIICPNKYIYNKKFQENMEGI